MGQDLRVSVPALVIAISLILLLILFWLFARNASHISKTLDKKQSLEYTVSTLASIVGNVAATCQNADTTAGPLTRDNCPQLFTLLSAIEGLQLVGDRRAYVFVVDSKGNQVVNGGNPQIAHQSQDVRPGANTLSYEDADGNKPVQMLLSKAATGGGYVEYKWPDPLTRNPTKKMAYVLPVPNTKWVLGSALYLNPTEDRRR
jgi:methyl-accepting chemotaxis protein